MEAIHRERICKVADAIENEENFFSMKTLWEREEGCGSPACIAGWTLALFTSEANESGHVNGIDMACAVLGLTSRQTDALFTPDTKTAFFHAEEGSPRYISRDRAVRQLRQLAETGKVNWRWTR